MRRCREERTTGKPAQPLHHSGHLDMRPQLSRPENDVAALHHETRLMRLIHTFLLLPLTEEIHYSSPVTKNQERDFQGIFAEVTGK